VREKEAEEPGWAFVFGWVFGRFFDLFGSRTTAWPRVAAVVAGLSGVSMLFQFWLSFDVGGNFLQPGDQPPWGWVHFYQLGHEMWQGWAACTALFALACLALATVRLPETRWPSVVLLLGGMAV